MAEELGCVKVSKLKHACFLVILLTMASCGGGKSDNGLTTNSDASINAAKAIAKNSNAGTSALILLAD